MPRIFFGILALLSAASWALGTVLWKRLDSKISSLGMNLAKSLIGSIYLAIIFSLAKTHAAVDFQSCLILSVSGIIGIGLGDTFFFASLKYLGARLSSLAGSLTPVAVTLSAILFLGERPSLTVYIGIFITVTGVIWVLNERLPQTNKTKNKSLGITFRIVSIICTAVGIILAKMGLSAMPALEATMIRLLSSIPFLLLWTALNRQIGPSVDVLKDPAMVKSLAIVVFIVTFGGFFLSLLALKHIDASVVGTLNATSPVFILPLSAIMLKEKITKKAIVATLVTVLGVALILLGG